MKAERSPAAASHEPAFPLSAVSIRKLKAQVRRFRLEQTYPEAIAIAEELARRRPGRSTYFELGWFYRESGDHRNAIRVFRDALRFETGPKRLLAEIHLHTAYAYFYLGDRELMSKARKRAYRERSKPKSGHFFHMILGTDYVMHHQYEEALEEYLHAERTAPDAMKRARAALNAGLVLVRMADFKRAKAVLDRALGIQERRRLRADLAATRLVRASLYFDMGQPRRALGMLRRATQTFRMLGKEPQEAEASQNLGYVAMELGLSTAAVAALDRAIELAAPKRWWRILSSAYAYRAVTYARLELFRAAEEDLVRASATLRSHRDAICSMHLARARARIAAIYGDWEREVRAAKQGERVAAGIPDVLRMLEFRRMRAAAEEKRGRARASVIAWWNAGRIERMLGRLGDRLSDRGDLERAAKTDLAIVITGEMGTGKTTLAHYIHRRSLRRLRRCVRVPCEQLVFPEAEIYGHEAGAWTGAERRGVGYARRADGGTLILDRVDEMDRRSQRLLIPVLDKRVRPVGGVVEEEVDVRIIAVCRDPERLLPEVRDRLRGNLFRVPALRERLADLPHLIRDFVRGRRRVTCDAIAELMEHPWEGNIAELEAVIERLVTLTDHSIGGALVRLTLRNRDSVQTGQATKIVSHSRRTRRNPAGALPARRGDGQSWRIANPDRADRTVAP